MTKQFLTDIAFYHDSPVTQWVIEQMGNLPTGTKFLFNTESEFWQGPNTLDDFITSTQHHAKIACFHVPFPEETTWMDRVRKVHPHCDHVIIFCSELHDPTVDQLYQLDLQKISMYICGFLSAPMKNANVNVWMDWFITTTHFYKNIQPKLLEEKLKPHQNKEYYFDILLGHSREHRDFVYNWIRKNSMSEKNILRYVKTIENNLTNDQLFILEKEGLEFIPDRKITHSVDLVNYFNNEISISQIVPITVYNQTHYSLIAETNFSNSFNFYTEKIVKPILAGRLFVVVAGKHYLKNLRKFGFETFNSVIDERYDDESDYETRWTKAMDQVNYLNRLDPNYVLHAIKEIVEHNRDLMLKHNWCDDVVDSIRNLVLGYSNNKQ